MVEIVFGVKLQSSTKRQYWNHMVLTSSDVDVLWVFVSIPSRIQRKSFVE
jgi:hypothetical protein